MLERNLVSGPVLTVVGSMHPSAAEQLAMLAAAGVQQIALRPRALMDDRAAEVARAVAAIRPALASGADMILALDRSERLRDASLPDRALAAALGEVVAELAPMLGGLVVTGGDTAAAVLLRLGAQSADILAEVRPGMPALVVRGGVCAGLPVVTKSGGFGAAQALLDAHYFLKGGDV